MHVEIGEDLALVAAHQLNELQPGLVRARKELQHGLACHTLDVSVPRLPLFSIFISKYKVELLVGGGLVERDDVGEHVDVAKALPENSEQGVLRDVVDDLQCARRAQIPLPDKIG